MMPSRSYHHWRAAAAAAGPLVIWFRLLLWLLCLATTTTATTTTTTTTVVMDTTGQFSTAALPVSSTTQGLVAVISSPSSPSILPFSATDTTTDDTTTTTTILGWRNDQILTCRGATFARTTGTATQQAVATCGVVASGIVVDGITLGDVEHGLWQSRHSRTLTALFRSQPLLLSSSSSSEEEESQDDASPSSSPVGTPPAQQTLILVVHGASDQDEVKQEIIDNKEQVESQVKALYAAVLAETSNSEPKKSFEECYDLHVVPASDKEQILALAKNQAAQQASPVASLANSLSRAHQQVVSSGLASMALDTPTTANAFVHVVGTTYSQLAQSIRAKLTAWNGRTARGLLVDNFGTVATALRQSMLTTFDTKTRSVAGLPMVAAYRQDLRAKLGAMLDAGIQNVFAAQVDNLLASSRKRLQSRMLRTIHLAPEAVIETNAAALRQESLTVETLLEDLQVPVLGLTKDKVAPELVGQLADAVKTFPDSPAAQIKRMQKIATVTKKERKPSQRSVDVGLDLVAMIRPDGFGSLQGYAGYQLGGNSITVGIHNDADDPQTIAQFGGVRPPLLRVQPKLRLDVEM